MNKAEIKKNEEYLYKRGLADFKQGIPPQMIDGTYLDGYADGIKQSSAEYLKSDKEPKKIHLNDG